MPRNVARPRALLPAVAAAAAVAAGVSATTASSTTDYRAFRRSYLASDDRLPPALLPVHWMAPYLSGGGLATEGKEFLFGLHELGANITAFQLTGDVDDNYTQGLPPLEQQAFQQLLSTRTHERSISVCHASPASWAPEAVNYTLRQFADAELYHLVSMCPHVVVDEQEGVKVPAPAFVGRVTYDEAAVPPEHLLTLRRMDELWVPSRWARDVLARALPSRAAAIVVVPGPVDTAFFDPAPYVALFAGVPPESLLDEDGEPLNDDAARVHDIVSDGALFLQALAWHGLPERDCGVVERPGDSAACPLRLLAVGTLARRKGWDLLLRAYLSEFAAVPGGDGEAGADAAAAAPRRKHVQLVVLTPASALLERSVEGLVAAASNFSGLPAPIVCEPLVGAGAPRVAPRKRACAPADRALWPPVTLLAVPLKSELLPAIYASVDALVAPARGEGWGRPVAEAMAMGLPVIATNWSGFTEYATSENSYPLRVTGLVEGGREAAPDVLHLRRLLRRVAERPDEAAERGRQARADMVRHFDRRQLARFVAHQLARISATMPPRDAATGALVGLHDAEALRDPVEDVKEAAAQMRGQGGASPLDEDDDDGAAGAAPGIRVVEIDPATASVARGAGRGSRDADSEPDLEEDETDSESDDEASSLFFGFKVEKSTRICLWARTQRKDTGNQNQFFFVCTAVPGPPAGRPLASSSLTDDSSSKEKQRKRARHDLCVRRHRRSRESPARLLPRPRWRSPSSPLLRYWRLRPSS